jgi:metallo-beta-lactamase class B
MRKPERIADGIYIVGGSDISHSYDCSVYLIDAGELVLVDAGAGQSFRRLMANIEQVGLNPGNLSTVLVTHCHIDHVGSLAELKRSYGVKIVAHELDAEAIETGDGVLADFYGVDYEPVKVDREVQGAEEKLSFGSVEVTAVHIPGHTPGSMALFVDLASGERVLFGQDIHGPYNPAWGADPGRARASLEKLVSLNADILCEGHFGIFRPAASVKKYISQYIHSLD